MEVGLEEDQRKLPSGGSLKGVLKEKVKYRFVRQRFGEGVFQAKGIVQEKDFKNWQKLGMTKTGLFFLRYKRSQIMKSRMCYATMFGFYFHVIFGKHCKGFVPANDLIKFVA